jgi:hypothetical protein
MNPDLPAHLQTTIESICEQGCEKVNAVIAALESGHAVEETAELAGTEEQQVLYELKAIMAVYDREQV